MSISHVKIMIWALWFGPLILMAFLFARIFPNLTVVPGGQEVYFTNLKDNPELAGEI